MPIPHPKPALSLTHDLLRALSMDTWWNFGHEVTKIVWFRKGSELTVVTGFLEPCEHSSWPARIPLQTSVDLSKPCVQHDILTRGVLWELDFFFVKDRPKGPPQGTVNC